MIRIIVFLKEVALFIYYFDLSLMHSTMQEIVQQIKSSKHYLIGICGIPGSGKSYHSQLLHSLLPNSIIIPMDGFHLYRQELTEQGKRFRGAAFTFNLQKFKTKIIELSKRDKFPIYFPSFDHALKDPIQNAINVSNQMEYIIVEGLYLFDKNLELDCWNMKIWIEADIQTAIQRVAKRHLLCGIEQNIELATERANSNDRKNAVYVVQNSDRASARIIANS